MSASTSPVVLEDGLTRRILSRLGKASIDSDDNASISVGRGCRVAVHYEVRVPRSETGGSGSGSVASQDAQPAGSVHPLPLSDDILQVLIEEYHADPELRARVAAAAQVAQERNTRAQVATASDLQVPFEVVDSSNHISSEQLLEFVVGRNEVLAGLDRGLLGMKVGDRALISATPCWAFGSVGLPPFVAPLEPSVEIFVDVVRVESQAGNSETDTLEVTLQSVEAFRLRGNGHFQASEFRLALGQYGEALRLIDVLSETRIDDMSGEDAETVLRARLPLHLNSAACHLKLDEPSRAIRHAELAIELEPANFKGHWRLGQALLADGEPSLAYTSILAAAKLDPQNRVLRKELEEAKVAIALEKDRQRQSMFSGMFS